MLSWLRMLVVVGASGGLVALASSDGLAQGKGKGKDGAGDVKAEIARLRAKIADLENKADGDKKDSFKKKFEGKFDPKKFGEGKGRFDPAKAKEMWKKFAEAKGKGFGEGKGKWDPAKAKEMWKKFAEAKGKGFGDRKGKYGSREGGKGKYGERRGPDRKGSPDAAKGRSGERKGSPDAAKGRSDTGSARSSGEVGRALDQLDASLRALRKALEKR
jgi:hypothetical protein